MTRFFLPIYRKICLLVSLALLASGALAQSTVSVIGPITPGDLPAFNSQTIFKDSGVSAASIPTGLANPTASVGLSTVNGSATTAMRSDGAPPLSASVQAALTATVNQFLIGTGAFGFSSLTQQAALNAIMCTPTRAGDIAFWNGSNWVCLAGNNSGTQVLSENASGVPAWSTAGGTVLTEPQGRITLTANTPVMTASASAQTTLRYDCYTGGNVPFFNGAIDAIDTVSSCEVTDAMVSAASAGQVVSNNVYDVWWVHGGANRICLAMSAAVGGGGGWSADTGGSNTARGTGYSQLDRVTRPYTTNKNSIANCFNAATNYGPVSANQGTYLGTVYASANGQISYIFGSSAAGGSAALLGVWNMYNRVVTTTAVIDSTSTWTTSTSATPAAMDGSTNNRITAVFGLPEDGIDISVNTRILAASASNANCAVGFALDATAAFDRQASVQTSLSTAPVNSSVGVRNAYSPQIGLHFFQALQAGDGTNGGTLVGGTTESFVASMRM